LTDLLGTLTKYNALNREQAVALALDLLLAGHETTGAHWRIRSSRCSGRRFTPAGDGAAIPAPSRSYCGSSRSARVVCGAGSPRKDVDVARVRIRAGDVVFAVMMSTNRDRAVLACPEQRAPERADNPHVAFGYGAHHCLGAPLARRQLEIGLGLLRARLPRLRTAVPLW